MIDSRGVEYDFGSLMHYSKFQGNNRPGVETIVPKDPQWILDSEKAQVNWTLNKPDLCTNVVSKIIIIFNISMQILSEK